MSFHVFLVWELLAWRGLVVSVPTDRGGSSLERGHRLYSFKKRCPSHGDEHFQSMCFVEGVESCCDAASWTSDAKIHG